MRNGLHASGLKTQTDDSVREHPDMGDNHGLKAVLVHERPRISVINVNQMRRREPLDAAV